MRNEPPRMLHLTGSKKNQPSVTFILPRLLWLERKPHLSKDGSRFHGRCRWRAGSPLRERLAPPSAQASRFLRSLKLEGRSSSLLNLQRPPPMSKVLSSLIPPKIAVPQMVVRIHLSLSTQSSLEGRNDDRETDANSTLIFAFLSSLLSPFLFLALNVLSFPPSLSPRHTPHRTSYPLLQAGGKGGNPSFYSYVYSRLPKGPMPRSERFKDTKYPLRWFVHPDYGG